MTDLAQNTKERMSRELVKTQSGHWAVADVEYIGSGTSKQSRKMCEDYLSRQKYDIEHYRESASKDNEVRKWIEEQRSWS